MTHVSLRLKVIFVVAASLAVLCLALLNLQGRIHFKEISDGVVWRGAPDGVTAWLVEPGPAREAGINRGDLLLEINGRGVRDLDDYYGAVDKIHPGSEGVYLIAKGGTGVRMSISLPLGLLGTFSSTDVYLALVAFVYLIVGTAIFLRTWRGPFSFHFFLVCLLSFILYLFRYTGKADVPDIAVYWLTSSALLILPVVFFHFCLNFPERNSWLRRGPLLAAGYASAAALLAVHAFWFAGALNVIGVPRNLFFRSLFDRLHLAYFVAWFCAAAAVLASSRLRCRSVEQRQQLKWIVRVTLLAIIPFSLCYALPFSLGIVPGRLMEMSILSLAVIPLGFGYAIVKYKLMDVDVIFKRGAAYFIASSGSLAIYSILVLFAGKLVLSYAPDAGFLLFALAALVTAFLFNPLRRRVQKTIDRIFYTEQYDYRASFSDFSRALSSEISLDRLSAQLLQRLQKTFNIEAAALMIRKDGDWFALSRAVNLHEERKRLCVPDRVFQDYDRELKPLYFSSSEDGLNELRATLRQMGLHYVQPLSAHDRVIALLALGGRRDGEWLSSEDLDLLQAISGYTAIAIENATLYRNLESKARELDQLKVFNESIVESIQTGVLTVDPQGMVTSLNSAVEKLLERSRADCVGQPLGLLLPRDVLEQVRVSAGDRWVLSEALHFYRAAVQTSAGEARIVNLHFAPFVSRHDVVTGTLVVLDDVTQKVHLEDKLLQAEKLTSLGLLAAGVAHEVNTPLAAISSYTQMLLKDFPEGHPRRSMLQKMESQTFRASEIVNNLLKFARLSSGDFKQLNLNHLVLETLSLLDHQLRQQNIEVATELDPGLPPTNGNGGKLQQVLMNILLNARDSMPQGGRITVRTESRDNRAVVIIRDSGAGIAREHIKRIYDPFFTTKEVGSGTGLGLSISYGIIQEHSGNIDVESEPGKGTAFTLQFPIRRVH